MKTHAVTLEPETPGNTAGAWRLLVDGHDLSEVVVKDGFAVSWRDGMPVVTITVFADRVHLPGATVEVLEALGANPTHGHPAGSATLEVVGEGCELHVVATQADEIISFSDELLRTLRTDIPRSPGDMEVDGDRIRFGTPGEGIGRVTYRLTGHLTADGYHLAVKVEDPPTP